MVLFVGTHWRSEVRRIVQVNSEEQLPSIGVHLE